MTCFGSSMRFHKNVFVFDISCFYNGYNALTLKEALHNRTGTLCVITLAFTFGLTCSSTDWKYGDSLRLSARHSKSLCL